jgi:SynChlorMet cassette radical SAM/SPASM protein ScmF
MDRRDRFEGGASETPPLSEIYLYLAGTCNLRCRHCWIDPGFGTESQRFLPWSELRKIFVQAQELGLRAVKLTGGEPLMHPEILDILRGLHQMGLKLRMESNGTLIGDRQAEVLRETGTDVSISLDGPTAELHDSLRGVPGAFDRALRGVESLCKQGWPPFQIIACLHQGTRPVLADMVRLAEDLGAGSLKINVVNSMGRSAEMERQGELLSVAEVLDAYRGLMTKLPEGALIRVFFDVPPAFKSLAELRAQARCSCGILNILGILSTGRASLCGIGEHLPALDFGNPLEVGLRTIWESNPTLQGIRDRLPDALGGVCGRCVFRRHCMGKCLAHNYWATGDLFAGFQFCQQALDAGLFPAKRLVRPRSQPEAGAREVAP